jgi:circadian clock protein KaiC
VLYFAFEESNAQIVRNMRSIGIDLAAHEKTRHLRFAAARPTLYGLEAHLVLMHREIVRFKPEAVVVDPINNLVSVGDVRDVRLMLMRLIDFLKGQRTTALLTSLTSMDDANEAQIGISSLMDTWLNLRACEREELRVYELFIIKSRGMSHSHTIRTYEITDGGLRLQPSPLAPR